MYHTPRSIARQPRGCQYPIANDTSSESSRQHVSNTVRKALFLAPTLFQLLLSTYQPWKIGIGVCGRPGTHRLIRHSRACWCLSFFFFRDAAARQPQPIECGKRFGEEVRSTVLYKKTLFCLCGVTRNPSPLERKSWRPAEYEHLIVVTVVTVGTAVTTYQVPFF